MSHLRYLLPAFLAFACVQRTLAGGSGLNTVVVVNQFSSNSCELGNYYCEKRQIPPENVLRIQWSGDNLLWSADDFQTRLVAPLLSMLSSRQLTNQIDFVVLSMDIPFRTLYGAGFNSTTSALFYGLKDEQGPDYLSVTNSYAASEQIFADVRPASAATNSFLTTMITAPTLAQARRLIDQGVTSDGSFPYQPVILAKSSDPIRNVRYKLYDNTVFNTRLCRSYSVQRTNCDSAWGQTNLLGFETGISTVSVSPNAFVPGAMADILTSWGGVIFGYNDQASLMSFITNGASGGYGSVSETYVDLAKFPTPQTYFYQARGFSIAECYYQGLAAPFQGLTVAEPLASPCRRLGSLKWSGINSNALSGVCPFSLQLSAADAAHPLQQIDLFVDGKFFRALTNLPPAAGNVLTVSLNGFPVSCTNPPNASLAMIASNLVSALNAPPVTNVTKTCAFAAGDRVELRSTFTNALFDPLFFTDPASVDNFRLYRLVLLPQSSLPTVSVSGVRGDGAFQLRAENPGLVPLTILASTNLFDWSPIFTNSEPGPVDFVDTAAPNFRQRFYRVAASIPDPHPVLSPLGRDAAGGFRIHVDAVSPAAYYLQASTDLLNWTALATNLGGGAFDFIDASAPGLTRRFYRAALVPPAPVPQPQIVFVSQSSAGSLMRVDNATRSYVLQASSGLFNNWIPIFTNLTPGQVRTVTRSDAGSAPVLTTFLTSARDSFLGSSANGYLGCSMSGSLQLGSWLQMTITKTNGVKVMIGVTNQIFGGTVSNLTFQLAALINASPLLQAPDGVFVDDLGPGASRSTTFNLIARRGGLDAAGIKVLFAGSPSVYRSPSQETALMQNLADLQPRNHLYVSAGASSLLHTFTLDTGALPDGYHELTAVAYEGTHVHTQTRATMPVTISNTPLSATLTLLDLGPTNSVSGMYHVQVSANTNAVNSIRLYSTGGLLNTVSNQSSATFAVDASFLGRGLHPFYAIVGTTSSGSFRTQPRYVRFQ